MPGKSGRRLVIDADVARSAGETKHPVSSACRQFLDAVTECRHRVVMTPEIQEEWRRHASRYTYRWLRRMFARRLVDRCTPWPPTTRSGKGLRECCRVPEISIYSRLLLLRTSSLLRKMSEHVQHSGSCPPRSERSRSSCG